MLAEQLNATRSAQEAAAIAQSSCRPIPIPSSCPTSNGLAQLSSLPPQHVPAVAVQASLH